MISMHRECNGGIGRTAASRRPDTSADKTSHRLRDTYRFKTSDRCGRTCLAIATYPGKRCDLSQLGQEDGGLLSEMRIGLVRNVCQQGLMEVNCGFPGPHRSSVSLL
jgi:hypothetical protein